MPPRYFVPELVNPVERLKLQHIDKRIPLPSFPEHVQIQTFSGCNANCYFCPNKKTELDIPLGKVMSDELFKSIVDQLTAQPTVRRISPYLMNESTLDKKLPERVRYITDKKKPHQYTKINSHGNALTESMAKGLLDAGLDRINFSVQGIEPATYKEIMALSFEKTVRNIEMMQKFRDEGGYKTRIRVVLLRTKAVDEHMKEIKKFWADRNIKININQLENRGSHKNIKSDEIAVHTLLKYHWCNRLFNQIYILWDGRMAMCCADWEQTGIMGDCSKDPIDQIWMGEMYKRFRKNFLTGEVKGMLCENCTKDGEDDED